MDSYEKQEIDSYLARFKDTPPEKILEYLGKLKAFFLKNMTPEGRAFQEAQSPEVREFYKR